MVLAAGLGTRLRPLTLDRPKALVTVGGLALIDHMIDRLAAAGVTRVVVNVHAFADDLEAHVRGRSDVEVLISDERDSPLETGGGLKAARPMLGDRPILVANIDSVWIETGRSALESLIAAWDGARMDDVLLLAPLERSLGFDGPGDFFLGDDGRLTHRGDAERAPHAYMGVHMINPAIIDGWPGGAHGILPLWLEMTRSGRLHGVAMDGDWMHVGDPAAREAAEARLAKAG
jgi:MurNAc alpha-1-phosphate uridylyltransferase